MSQLLVRAPDRVATPGKAEVSDVGGEEHPPGPFDKDAQLAAEGRHLRQVVGPPDEPGGQPADGQYSNRPPDTGGDFDGKRNFAPGDRRANRA